MLGNPFLQFHASKSVQGQTAHGGMFTNGERINNLAHAICVCALSAAFGTVCVLVMNSHTHTYTHLSMETCRWLDRSICICGVP